MNRDNMDFTLSLLDLVERTRQLPELRPIMEVAMNELRDISKDARSFLGAKDRKEPPAGPAYDPLKQPPEVGAKMAETGPKLDTLGEVPNDPAKSPAMPSTGERRA